jgi:hypothetical protein
LHAQYESFNEPRQKAGSIRNQFALQQYNRAILSLKQRLSEGQESIEVALMCCVLFICLECLRGNREWVLSHLQNGLNILAQARAKQSDLRNVKCYSFGSDFVEQKLSQIFSRLLAQLTLLAKPISDTSAVDALDQGAIVMVPSIFNNLFEAKASIDTLVMSSLQFVQSTIDNKYITLPTTSARIQQLELQTQFQQWLCSFETLIKFTKTFNHQSLLLHIQYRATYIWLSTCLISNETIFDTYMEDFESIVTCAQHLAATLNTRSLFTLDMAIIPPLYLTAIKCRSPWIRHKAAEQLDTIPGREGLWDAKIHAKVAKRVIAIEEAAIEEADDLPPESFRVKNAQILSDMTRDPPRNYVVFHTKPNGLDGEWVTWEEDIVL